MNTTTFAAVSARLNESKRTALRNGLIVAAIGLVAAASVVVTHAMLLAADAFIL